MLSLKYKNLKKIFANIEKFKWYTETTCQNFINQFNTINMQEIRRNVTVSRCRRREELDEETQKKILGIKQKRSKIIKYRFRS